MSNELFGSLFVISSFRHKIPSLFSDFIKMKRYRMVMLFNVLVSNLIQLELDVIWMNINDSGSPYVQHSKLQEFEHAAASDGVREKRSSI